MYLLQDNGTYINNKGLLYHFEDGTLAKNLKYDKMFNESIYFSSFDWMNI